MIDLKKLTELIEDSGLPYKKTNKSWILTCPRCGKKGKLYIRREDGRFVCWVCKETEGYAGRPEYALSDLLGHPVQVIQGLLYGTTVPNSLFFSPRIIDYFDDGDNDFIELPEAYQLEEVYWPFDFFPIDDQHAERGRTYLEGRGIPLDVATRYGIRYCPSKRRVVFPVEVEGKLVGWQERLIVPHRHFNVDRAAWTECPKAITSTGMKRDSVLMFGDRLKGVDHVVLCEGPVDAIKADLCGGNVATLGKAVTAKQVELLKNGGVKKVYFGLDRDAAKEIQRLSADFMAAGIECYDMRPPVSVDDLGAMSFSDVRELFLRAERIRPGYIFVYLNC